jgi:hypothetical protein
MMTLKPFRYSKFRMPKYSGKPPKVNPLRDTEVLTGVINGEACSDLEERFAVALNNNKRVDTFEFQPSFIALRNMPGEIRPDFIVYSGGMLHPIFVDGEFVHQSAEQQAQDRMNDAILDERLAGSGAVPARHVSGKFLQTPEDAEREVREIFG